MKRVYLSGAQKRKKGEEKEKQIAKLQKISDFCTAVNKVTQPVLSTSSTSNSNVCDVNIIEETNNESIDPSTSLIARMSNAENLNEESQDVHSTPSTLSSNVCVVQSIEESNTNTDPINPPASLIPKLSNLENNEVEQSISDSDDCTENNVNVYVPTVSTDPSLWKINQDLISYCVRKGSSFCRNKDMDFKKSVRTYGETHGQKSRRLKKSLFYTELKNGETVDREWLLYSPSSGSVYCFVCRLFSTKNSQFSSTGFDDWKNGIRRVKEHEDSYEHRECLIIYSKRKSTLGRIDDKILNQFNKDMQYWHDLLNRLVVAIKFLASRGLAFRGSNQELGSTKNGNYLGLLEVISQFDPFLKNHFDLYGNKGRGKVSYLSANICEELIELMGKRVLEYIICELKKSKYYSICVDSTPDITHIDQLTFTVRYVVDDGPIERFMTFIPIEAHGAEYLANVVMSFLEDNNIDLNDCRGQSYDNAANMSGQYSGLQARIKEVNKYAEYIPCSGHSLNLVGVRAAECNLQIASFFILLQKLYTFFSLSTYRWQKLVKSLKEKKVLKSLSDTRWSARADAVSTVHNSHPEVLDTLDDISTDKTQKNDTQLEALSLKKKLEKFSNMFLIVVWNDILLKIHATNLTLQTEKIHLGIVVDLLDSLVYYLSNLRDQFDVYLGKAKKFANIDEIPNEDKRPKTRSVKLTRNEGSSQNTTFNACDSFRIEIFYPIIDSLVSSLKQRRTVYDVLNNDFSFFTHLRNLTEDSITENCSKLAKKYDKDLSEENLISECIQFKYYLLETRKEIQLDFSDLYTQIKKECLKSTFPNIEISLRIFLSMMVTNCSGERSFSALKFIKNDNRNAMLNPRLNYLSIMFIESEVLNNVSFEDIISDFAHKKSRKKL